MADIISRGRDEMPGGHKNCDYLDRSRSRDVIVRRGEDYGRRGDRDARRDRSQEKDAKIRGKDDSAATNAGPETEGMHRGSGGYQGGGGFQGGHRDRSDRHEGGGGGGYRDRDGGNRDRGGFRGGPPQSSGPKVSTVSAGDTVQLFSNHFKFQNSNIANKIYIYNVEYGVFDNREDRFGALKSIQS